MKDKIVIKTRKTKTKNFFFENINFRNIIAKIFIILIIVGGILYVNDY